MKPPLPGSIVARPPWLVTLVDLIALMLAMFVLIFATQGVEAAKWHRIAKSLSTAFVGDGLEGKAPSRGAILRTERPALDLGYLDVLLRDKLERFGGVRVERRRDSVAIVLPDSARATLFDLANVLASLDNAIFVHAAVRYGDWERAIARAQDVAGALQAAGYPRPVAALARAGSAEIEILVRPGAGFE